MIIKNKSINNTQRFCNTKFKKKDNKNKKK